MNKLGELIMKSGGLTQPRDMVSPWLLRELETKKSVFVLGCDVVISFLYSPPSLKLEGTLGYTYCSKSVFGSFLSGWVAAKATQPIMETILTEFDKRCVAMSGTFFLPTS